MQRRAQIINWLRGILNKNLSGMNYRAFIFGSQANKDALIRADIDIGIMAEESIAPCQLSRIYAEIEGLPMLYNIDLVDFKDVDPKFKSVALQNIELL